MYKYLQSIYEETARLRGRYPNQETETALDDQSQQCHPMLGTLSARKDQKKKRKRGRKGKECIPRD